MIAMVVCPYKEAGCNFHVSSKFVCLPGGSRAFFAIQTKGKVLNRNWLQIFFQNLGLGTV